MAIKYSIHRAKTNLSKLIEIAEHGETVIIARGDKPVAKITSLKPKTIKFGVLSNLINTCPNDWFEGMSGEELNTWEGN